MALYLPTYIKQFECKEITEKDIQNLLDSEVEEHVIPQYEESHNVRFARFVSKSASPVIDSCISRSLTSYSYLLNIRHDFRSMKPYIMLMKPGGYLNLATLSNATSLAFCTILNLSQDEVMRLSLCHGEYEIAVKPHHMVIVPSLALLSGASILPVDTHLISLMSW